MRPHGGSRELLGSGRVGSKEPVGQPAAADVKRPHMLEFEMRIARVVRADDDLRRAAAGICHGNALAGKIVGDPIECEPRLHALSHVGNNGMLLRIHDRAIAHACEREPR